MNATSFSRFSLLALLVLGFAAAAPVRAQDRPAYRATPAERVERRVEHLDQKLDLTDAQAAQIRQILEERARTLEARRSEARAERRQKREARAEQFRAEAEATDRAVAAVLTPEQQQAYAELKTEARAKVRREDGRARSRRAERVAQVRHHAAAFARRLDLTEAQQDQMRQLFEARRAEARAWREAHPNASADEKRAYFEQQLQATDAAVEALLTPEQVEKYRTLKNERRERREQRGPHRKHGRS